MRKMIALLATAVLLGVATPATADETATAAYTLALGASVLGTGTAVVACQGEPEGEICEEQGIAPIGGGRLNVGGSYNNLVATMNDDLFGASGGISLCFYTGADNICDDDDIGTDVGCGSAAIVGAHTAANEATFWAWSVVVTEDLEVCGGSTGSVSGTFF